MSVHVHAPPIKDGEKHAIHEDCYRPRCRCSRCSRFVRLTHMATVFSKIEFSATDYFWDLKTYRCWGDCSRCGHVEIHWDGEYPWDE